MYVADATNFSTKCFRVFKSSNLDNQIYEKNINSTKIATNNFGQGFIHTYILYIQNVFLNIRFKWGKNPFEENK